jgi:26 proteasome complex subunit DSS1
MAEKAQQTEKKDGESSVPANGATKELEKKKLPQLGAVEDDDEFEVCHSFPYNTPINPLQDFPASG